MRFFAHYSQGASIFQWIFSKLPLSITILQVIFSIEKKNRAESQLEIPRTIHNFSYRRVASFCSRTTRSNKHCVKKAIIRVLWYKFISIRFPANFWLRIFVSSIYSIETDLFIRQMCFFKVFVDFKVNAIFEGNLFFYIFSSARFQAFLLFSICLFYLIPFASMYSAFSRFCLLLHSSTPISSRNSSFSKQTEFFVPGMRSNSSGFINTTGHLSIFQATVLRQFLLPYATVNGEIIVKKAMAFEIRGSNIIKHP